jgi:RNA polymerase sigma-70 factor (ECF subfamily)
MEAVDGGDALAAIYTSDAARLERFVVGIVGDADAARDIVQDAMAKALETSADPAVTVILLSAWVYRVARNAALDHIRMQRRTTCEAPAAIDERREGLAVAAASPPEWGAHEGVHTAISLLPTCQRQVIALRYRLGLTARETATVLGKSTDSVRHIEARALRSLRAARPESGS